jgi:hypothetical protein
VKYLLVWLILGLTGCGASVEEETHMENNVTGWSASGELDPLNPGQGGGVVHLQVNFPEAGNYTVQFNVSDPNAGLLVNNEVVRAQAEVVWSVNGQQIRRLVDCVKGLSITGTAESVAVNIIDRSSVSASPVVPYIATVTVAKGTRSSVQQPPTYTGERVRLTAGGGSSIQIPEGAISVNITIAPLIIGAAIIPEQHIVRETGNGGINLKSWNPTLFEGWIPLAAGATKISFEQSALQGADFYYFTSFGIDG